MMPESLKFLVISFVITFVLSPPTIWLLKKFKLTRKCDADPSGAIQSRACKTGVPMMGGLLVVFVIVFITYFFNWERRETFVPIGILLVSSLIGGIDDLLNIFEVKRRERSLKKVLTLIKVHKNKFYRVFLVFTLPWQIYKRIFFVLGSTKKGRGVFPHEKILFQFAAGGILAWWISFKLGWTSMWIPFFGRVDVGPYIMIALVMLIVAFMTNAVNFSDGLDGLSAGLLLITFSAYMFIAWQQGFDKIAILLGTIIGALLAYLWFNVKPARYQLGDVGSLGLGALLTSIAFAMDQVYLLFIVGGVFVVELLSVLLQQAWKVLFGKRLFYLTPLHHHFEYKGMSEETIVMKFWVFGIILAFIGIWISTYQ